MEKHTELKRAKLLALSLLLIAVAAFITTLFLPQTFWVRGGIAVVALFRRVPIPFISRHTAIIPRKKTASATISASSCRKSFSIRNPFVDLIRRTSPHR